MSNKSRPLYKKKYALSFTLWAIAFSILQLYCSYNPDKKLNEAIELYHNGNTGSLQQIESEFIKKISTESFDTTGLHTDGNVLYFLKDNEIDIIHPVKKSYSHMDEERIEYFDFNRDYCVISNGKDLSIFDNSGDRINVALIGDKKNRIKSLTLYDNRVIYYKDTNLFSYDIILESNEKLLKDAFPPPYSKYYKVIFFKSGDLLGLLTGIAGLYYLSIIDLAGKIVKIKNISISSSKLFINKKKIYYIFGNTGKWELKKFLIDRKIKRTVHKFIDLIDIELTSTGFIFEDSKGLWAAIYGEKKIFIPFNYQLSGKYRDMLLLKHSNKIYIVDMKKLIFNIKNIRNRVPKIFAF